MQLTEVITVKQTEIETTRFTVSKRDRELNELHHTLADYDEIKRQNTQYKRDIHESNDARA